MKQKTKKTKERYEKTFVLEKSMTGAFEIIDRRFYMKSTLKSLGKFRTPNLQGLQIHKSFKSLKEGDRIKIQVVKRR